MNYAVKIGNITIGKGHPIAVQSMCNTPTADITNSVVQCEQLFNAGAEIIRLTTQGLKEVESLREIKEILRAKGIDTPLVADVHYSGKIALEAAKVADKVRINPGNFAKNSNDAKRDFSLLTAICKEYNTALRIGINHGSLGNSITEQYGNTPKGMSAAACEWIEMAREESFHNFAVSLKASNTLIMAEAYINLNNFMLQQGYYYPLHLGVTEAGNGDQGRIKSAVGISALLKKGIGDTIRVSLTENPVNEIPVARFIVNHFYDNKRQMPVTNIDSRKVLYSASFNDYDSFILTVSCDLGPLLLEREIDDFEMDITINGKAADSSILGNFKNNLLQASRRKFSSPEYIACPGCGRTSFDLEKVFNEVKAKTSHLKGYNIAVMGCIVNGPGEMADADYGYVGEGKNKVSIYRGKSLVYRSVDQKNAIDLLLKLIDEDVRNKVFRPRSG